VLVDHINVGRAYRMLDNGLTIVVSKKEPNGQVGLLKGEPKIFARYLCQDYDGEIDVAAVNFVSECSRRTLVEYCKQEGMTNCKAIQQYLVRMGISISYQSVYLAFTGKEYYQLRKAENKVQTSLVRMKDAFTRADIAAWKKFVNEAGGAKRAKALIAFVESMK
jgi:hypothetical protein